ncbi:bifunctional ADP-dependent (S)-NAD(P)H-hydrate dehydratase/NAD(P)H-hydrate epimerase [Dictyobacter vulcani]|uniref:Bifunctional NAD(P)H-hydrate repair enzyme n=1 Tax=Dictyobacter vulcani TaxID=2607529 RepID=A0A5J4KHF4_9CHLR|nr:NAD(P)H-hydrate dehydratase [Dictyobacter vulcani]GER87143.1 bifunctional ADP-dependent (S)-NAD(P)H-hydrate dehydratase/NAD(P)H-hydrate epimerase [Dictyobacter vulcani]
MHIVTISEMKTLEAQAEQQYGLTSPILMQNAGKSAADLFEANLLPTYSLKGLKVLFLIGPGNNGGDGLVMAEHLKNAGALISLYHWKEQKLIVQGKHQQDQPVHELLTTQIKDADYIIDALLGTGRSRPLPDDMRALLALVKEERSRRESLGLVAIDLPTGLNADTGEVDPGSIAVDTTITLAYPKLGFFFFPGRDYIGDLEVGDIGLPDALEPSSHTEMITGQQVHKLLPERPLNSNKGTFGKVMLLCGSLPYPGSAFLAGNSAARVGAGLITLAVTEKMLPFYASSFHEATFAILPEEDAESFERAKALIEKLEGYKALLIGPGLGQSANTREVILQVLEHLRSLPDDKRPHLVIDADGLNNLSALERWWTLLPKDTVITPHPGEMGRLSEGIKVSGGNIERLELARKKAQEWQVNLLLKGSCTLIANPTGNTRINWWGNPALATAGTGDVLAGMISGFLAQGMSPFDAASAAVYLHTAAADLVNEHMNIERAGLLASDLLPYIPMSLVNTTYSEL